MTEITDDTLEADEQRLREYRRKQVIDFDEKFKEHENTILCSAATAKEWFTDSMSEEEIAATSRYLVMHGLAEWVYKAIR